MSNKPLLWERVCALFWNVRFGLARLAVKILGFDMLYWAAADQWDEFIKDIPEKAPEEPVL